MQGVRRPEERRRCRRMRVCRRVRRRRPAPTVARRRSCEPVRRGRCRRSTQRVRPRAHAVRRIVLSRPRLLVSMEPRASTKPPAARTLTPRSTIADTPVASALRWSVAGGSDGVRSSPGRFLSDHSLRCVTLVRECGPALLTSREVFGVACENDGSVGRAPKPLGVGG